MAESMLILSLVSTLMAESTSGGDVESMVMADARPRILSI
jgi:hypothetical protein